MLQIIQGRSIATWQLAAPADADVLLVGSTALESTRHAPELTGKLLIEVTDDRTSAPATTPFVLRYPFRVMQLLDLLDGIVGHLGKSTGESPTLWATANALRKASQQAEAGGWQVARASNGARVWLDTTSIRTDARNLEQLDAAALDIGSFTASAAPPPDAARFARADFFWRTGLHGPDALAPWMDGDTHCELQHWPDFGRLGASEPLLDVCARLASHPRTPNELVAYSRSGTIHVHRFLAAASLAGWLSSGRQPHRRAAGASGIPLRNGWSRLLAQLRRRLA